MSTTHRHISTKRIALLGVLTGLALVAGYVEVIFPLPVSVPGVKLGLGNVVVLFALERLSARDALWLMLAKVSASTLLFGNPQVLMFSLAGGTLSWAVMSLAHKSGLFSTVGLSVLGGLSHNAGQLALVAYVLSPAVALLNLPVLAISGVAAGASIGLIVRAALAALPFEEPKELR